MCAFARRSFRSREYGRGRLRSEREKEREREREREREKYDGKNAVEVPHLVALATNVGATAGDQGAPEHRERKR